MNSKLTLRMKTQVIEEAKKYAKERETSLSLLVESYFGYLAFYSKKKRVKKKSIARELGASIKVPQKFDWKKERTDYLVNKYLR